MNRQEKGKRKAELDRERERRRDLRSDWVRHCIEDRPHPTLYGQRASMAMWSSEYDRQLQSHHEGPYCSWRCDWAVLPDEPEKPYRHWLHALRRGQEVSACYDGKGGRAVRGVVVRARKGWAVVEFPRWAGEGTARVRFVDGAGWDRGGESMRAIGIGRGRGDFYRIVSIEQCPPREDESGAAAVVRALRAAVVSAATEAVCPA
jgi:hypothetical protein